MIAKAGIELSSPPTVPCGDAAGNGTAQQGAVGQGEAARAFFGSKNRSMQTEAQRGSAESSVAAGGAIVPVRRPRAARKRSMRASR